MSMVEKMFRGCVVDEIEKKDGNLLTLSVRGAPQSVTVDLDKNILAAQGSSVPAWNAVEIDAGSPQSATGFEGLWPFPQSGAFSGRLYLEETFAGNKGIPKTPPGLPGDEHEFRLCVVPQGQGLPKRFYGFHGRIVELKKLNGVEQALVAIYARNRTAGFVTPQSIGWIDLKSAFVHQTLTRISQPGDEGPIFLAREPAKLMKLKIGLDTKEPRGASDSNGGPIP
jgi:hypothetical protein